MAVTITITNLNDYLIMMHELLFSANDFAIQIQYST